jgi:hypothetical protein
MIDNSYVWSSQANATYDKCRMKSNINKMDDQLWSFNVMNIYWGLLIEKNRH